MERVTQLINANGRAVANQFVITDNGKQIFQSYKTRIAEVDGTKITLDTNAMGYSNTTSKYLYQLLGMNRKELEKGIKNNEILVKDLN